MNGPQTPSIDSKKEYMDYLATILNIQDEVYRERGRPREFKTFIIESNSDLHEFNNRFSYHIKDTGVEHIKFLHVYQHDRFIMECILDLSDKRFWIMHTNALASTTKRVVSDFISARNYMFDNTWFPSNLLEKISNEPNNKFNGFRIDYEDIFSTDESLERPIEEIKMRIAGMSSNKILNIISNEQIISNLIAYTAVRVIRGSAPTVIKDEINYYGMIAVKYGDSIDDHISLVNDVKEKYKQLITTVEDFSIGVRQINERTLVEGKSIDFVFKRRIENWDIFFKRLFSHTFKLWGLKSRIKENYYHVLAIDLHTGHSIDLEVMPDTMRIYLPKGTCGNVVLRLLVNLQHRYDSNIKCEELNID